MFGLLLLSSLSFGTTLESFRTSFDTAMKAYNAQEYANAYQLFYALVENAPENAEESIFTLGALLELKKYKTMLWSLLIGFWCST